jgi:hypothetical protein
MIGRFCLRKRGLIPSVAFVVSLLSSCLVYAGWENVVPPSVDYVWELRGVHFTSSHEGWAVGGHRSQGEPNGIWKGGALLHYSGNAWSNVTPPSVSSFWNLYGVHFSSSSEGWAVGADDVNFKGVLLHYSGGTWSNVPAPDMPISPRNGQWFLFGVHFPSPSEGWAVGEIDDSTGNRRGVLLHYSGGAWTFVGSPPVSSDWALRSVHFTSPSEGWAVGFNGTSVTGKGVLLHYSGGVWSNVTPPSVSDWWDLWSVHFTSPSEGWAVGEDYINNEGVILHYSGGVWTNVTPPPVSNHYSLTGVHFTSPSEGWAVGTGTNVIFHYSGGVWSNVTPFTISGLPWGVYFPLPNRGWVVGSGFNDEGLLLLYAAPTSYLIGQNQQILTKNTYIFNTKGDVKFQNSSYGLSGNLEVYLNEDGFVSNDEGCYLKFTGDDGSGICIDRMGSASTDVQKSKTDQWLLIGTGEMTIPVNGVPKTGIVYVDLKGTVKKNSSGGIESVSITGKMGGSGSDFVSSGSYRMTLTMEER